MEGANFLKERAPSVAYALHTRKPFTPSSIVTWVNTLIPNLFVTRCTSARAASWSMQGTKNENPLWNLDQSSWYVTVSIFMPDEVVYLYKLKVLGIKT